MSIGHTLALIIESENVHTQNFSQEPPTLIFNIFSHGTDGFKCSSNRNNLTCSSRV